ncbi:eryA [Symbiodinium sp. CCMP2456]|nr:eryA [Symbiodinium sp. CCMP2456]
MIPARSSLRHGDGADLKNGLRKTAVGLDLGRRLLVVLKSTSKPSEKAQAIRVVDHGEQQKEALRRLYDAQVLLQSYEDQLHAKDEQLYKIQVCVKKAIRESSADYLREPELIESLGFSEEELHAEGIATEQKPTGKMARFEAMLDQSFENQKWEEKQDRERRAKDLQANGSSLPVLDPQSDMQWFKVPYWIKADEETREMVQKIKQHFMDEMNAKGHFDHNAFLEHLWQCGFQVAQHWAGSPNEELVKQVEAAEKKARSVQREALQETSMLRQHIKRVERKYKELQSNAAKMQKAMSTMASQLKEARDTAAMFGVELPSSPSDTSNRRPSVLMGFGQQGRPAPAGHLAVPGAPAKSERRMSVADGGLQVGGLPDVPEHHGQGPGVVSPLHADDTLEIMADQMQLDEMDNEIFEPLNQFDDDLKDLMIDCITEKVRRILSLDPSKYKNGRLPFGLKPHKGLAFADDETDLEAELERMRELYERLKEENEQLLRQLEAARAAAERWKQKYLELQNKPAEVQEEKVVLSRPASVKTTPETPKEREPTPPPVIKGLSDEEVKRLLEEQEKAYKTKIAALEKRIKQLEDELAKLKAEKDKAEAKAKEAAETAQKERERRETLQKEQEQAREMAGAGCAPMKRPAALELFLVAAVSFVVSALCAAATDLIPWKLRELPMAMRWRARATVASLHQPVAVLFLLPPSEALEIFLFTGGNQWTISAPRNLWLTLFYLLGAWFFELLILLHPSTGAMKSYGRRGWSVQAAHHLGFPAFALHNIISGCAVPGTAVACYTELTVFFTSSFWIAKMVGAGDIVLVPIKVGMVIFTFVLRGGCVLLLDLRAILNDQSELPVASWLTQCLALVGMNVLNLLILRLVSGAVMRGSKVDSGWTSVMEHALKLAMHHLGPTVSERILLEMQSAHEDSSHPSSLERLFQLFRQPPFLEEKAAVPAPVPNGPGSAPGGGHVQAQPSPSIDREKLREMMIRLAAEAAGFPVEAEKPLLDSGMDSKAAVQFSAKLATELPDLRLPSTLVFDYPTLSAVAAYAEEAQRPRERKHLQIKKPVASSDPLSVIGAACAFPGDACSPGKFGALLASGTDGIVEVPFTRWELCEYYDPNPDAPGKMYPCHAAFIEGAEDFAASYFNISAPEARAMDPQQRLVLEVCHDSLLESTFSREALLGSSTAAIVGVSNNDWIQVQSGDIRKLNPYTATGTSASVAAARVAFCLGLKGPAYVVDTACSSALVAVDAAAMNIRRGRCSAAVSAAANVIASPATFISFSKPRMLSPRGRSHAFDASADGYGRGEGAGAVALCPLKADGGSARAALRGTAVNQDGRSSTMTAPNGPSQTMVVATALAEAMLQHHQVRHFEAHGTGTPLGDPIEVGALQAGSLDEGARQQPVGLAAVKTNVGHLEGAAASPGLLKTVALLSRRTAGDLVSSARALSLVHLHALNPHLTLLEDVPQVFPSEHFPLPAQKPRTGGLSSFGFGGIESSPDAG